MDTLEPLVAAANLRERFALYDPPRAYAGDPHCSQGPRGTTLWMRAYLERGSRCTYGIGVRIHLEELGRDLEGVAAWMVQDDPDDPACIRPGIAAACAEVGLQARMHVAFGREIVVGTMPNGAPAVSLILRKHRVDVRLVPAIAARIQVFLGTVGVGDAVALAAS